MYFLIISSWFYVEFDYRKNINKLIKKEVYVNMVHYNNQDSLHRVFTLKGTIIRDISPQILLYICVSTGMVIINHYYVKININQTPWVIVGGALGLLLVFRTNTAYDRYWEGRKLFGGEFFKSLGF